MMDLHKIIATGLGIGFIRRGSGTIAAAVCCVVWYLMPAGNNGHLVAFLITLTITGVGVWSAGKVEKYWGVDNNRVVIDEIAGMCISLVFVPVGFGTVLAAFILFRFFDIVKPAYIRRAENLPAGWGVMADDVLAGLYTNIIVQVAVRTSIL
jgi:phosphatidylglycerophosphatase A